MFILKPLKSSLFGKQDIETIEEVVQDSRLVDKGIKELKTFSANAPSFDPDRRKFLKHAAALTGVYATGQLLKGCATIEAASDEAYGPPMKLPAPRGGVSFRIICKTLDSTRQTKSAQVKPSPRVILRPQAEESPAKRDPSLCSG